ncbi:MAG: DUF4115 domain-containing protein, partial [Alphaproteobacteria bacterium]|nr:DUF4115 domain-containing protein [Alphaproteobacteria bacterium]
DCAAAGLTAPVAAAPDAAPATPPAAEAIPPAAPGIVLSGNVPPALAPAKEADAAADKDDAPPKAAKPAKEKKVESAAPAPAPAPSDAAASNDIPAAAKDTAKDTSKDARQIFGDPGAPSRIIIRATQSSWVMVTDAGGKTIFDHVLKDGDIYKVPNKPGLKMTTGNGNGLTLSLDGSDLPRIAAGAPHVVRDIPLDPDRLGSASNSN